MGLIVVGVVGSVVLIGGAVIVGLKVRPRLRARPDMSYWSVVYLVACATFEVWLAHFGGHPDPFQWYSFGLSLFCIAGACLTLTDWLGWGRRLGMVRVARRTEGPPVPPSDVVRRVLIVGMAAALVADAAFVVVAVR